MKHKNVLATLVFTLTAVFFSTTVVAGGAQEAIDAAIKAQKEAKSLVGFEWRDMGKMIKKAQAHAKKGEDKKAIKIANKIAGQIVVIKKQAELAKNAGPTF